MNGKHIALPIEFLNIWSENPRHSSETENSPTLTEAEIINILIDTVGQDYMYNLAADILDNGLMGNVFPVAVFEKEKYNVYDGNRRISAIKILINSTILEERFAKLKSQIDFLRKNRNVDFLRNIIVYVTDKEEALNIMDKTHSGSLEGIGVIQWDAYQRDNAFNKRGKPLMYPTSYAIVKLLSIKKGSFKDFPYTSFERIFGHSYLKDFFKIDAYNIANKSKTELILSLLIDYQNENKEALSRLFNKPDIAMPLFCEWADKKVNSDKYIKIVFSQTSYDLFFKQNFDLKNIKFDLKNYEDKLITYEDSDIKKSIFDPKGKEQNNIDTSICGCWTYEIGYKSQIGRVTIRVNNPVKPRIIFQNSNSIKLIQGLSVDLKDQILSATDSYGNNVLSEVEIVPLNKETTIIENNYFSIKNSIGQHNIIVRFKDVLGADITESLCVTVESNAVPLKGNNGSQKLLSFRENLEPIDICYAVNELVEQINKIDKFEEYNYILGSCLRSLVELTLEKLGDSKKVTFTSSKRDLKKDLEDLFKKLRDSKILTSICDFEKRLSYLEEKNFIDSLDLNMFAAKLHMGAHKSASRLGEQDLKTLGLIIANLLVLANILLKIV